MPQQNPRLDSQQQHTSGAEAVDLSLEIISENPAQDGASPEARKTPLSETPQLETATSAIFASRSWEKTLVTIPSPTILPDSTKLQQFYAVQNHLASRHTLEYQLIESVAGEVILCGEIRELGTLPLVTGPFNRELEPSLFSFELNCPNADYGERIVLIRNAQALIEVFADSGALGVHEFLERNIVTMDRNLNWLNASPSFQRELDWHQTPLAERPITANRLSSDKLPSSSQANANSYHNNPSHILESLTLIGDVSQDEFDILHKDAGATVQQALNDYHDNNSMDEFSHISINRFNLFGNVQATFSSMPKNLHQQVMVALSFPIFSDPSRCVFPKLMIDVLSPKRAYILRDRYSCFDYQNIMKVSSYENNNEFFRNLFRTLHRENAKPIHQQRSGDSLINLLSEYGLTPQPTNISARAKALYQLVAQKLRSPR